MSARIIDGKFIAAEIRSTLKLRANDLIAKEFRPGLAVIIVGDDAASNIYVNNKIKACREINIHSEVHRFPDQSELEDILQCIQEMNENPSIHGILVQLPLPQHFDSSKITASIAIEKDVDGFHLCNIGALVTGNALFLPCTPYGVMTLLEKYNIPIEGSHAVIVGRSNIVGKPMSLMLLEKNATVTICSSKTRNLASYTKSADILVAATGKLHLITAEMIKPGSAVIDVGINRLVDGRLVGDVDYESVKEKAGYITPVPGGVGPMTITMLLYNTLVAAERSQSETLRK